MGFRLRSPQIKLDWTAISIEVELVTKPSILASAACSGQLSCISFLHLSLCLYPFWSLLPPAHLGWVRHLRLSLAKSKSVLSNGNLLRPPPCSLPPTAHKLVPIWMRSRDGEDYWWAWQLSKTFSSSLQLFCHLLCFSPSLFVLLSAL